MLLSVFAHLLVAHKEPAPALVSGILPLKFARHRGVNPFHWRAVGHCVLAGPVADQFDREHVARWNADDRITSRFDRDGEGAVRLFQVPSSRLSPPLSTARRSVRSTGQ